MQLKPYRELLTMAKEAIDTALAPIRARAAKKKAELEIAKLDEKIAVLEREITEACAKQDINFDTVIDKMDDLELTERRRSQFIKIIDQLFPEEK